MANIVDLMNTDPAVIPYFNDVYSCGLLYGYLSAPMHHRRFGDRDYISITAGSSVTDLISPGNAVYSGIRNIIELHSTVLWLGRGRISFGQRFCDFINDNKIGMVRHYEPLAIKPTGVSCNRLVENLILIFGFSVEKDSSVYTVNIFPNHGPQDIRGAVQARLREGDTVVTVDGMPICENDEFWRGFIDGFNY